MRVEYAGAIYHVMNRGDRRELVFTEDSDRRRFLETLGEACVKTGWQVHADVLMPNHFHWVIETPQPNLVAGMKWLLATDTNPVILALAARLRAETTQLTVKWIAERLGMGTRGHLNHLLYRKRKTSRDLPLPRTDLFTDPV